MSSRKRLLTRGVFFGYGALFTQVFYSLASIPLALSYLSKAEFGMWSLITGLVAYLDYLQFGMGAAFNRHLFECRDSKEDGRYGRFFVASLIALGGAGFLMLGTGVLLTFGARSLYPIPPELSKIFLWVMLGRVLINSAGMAARTFGTPLYVHQRHDLTQISQITLYVVLYAVLYLALEAGWGLYAMLANSFVGLVWSFIFSLVACSRLKLYPPRGTWCLPERAEMNSVMRFSRDMFVIQIGQKLANGMPILLLPRLLGLEAVAIWTVCTRPFNILMQMVGKPYEYSMPMLMEIFVKGEHERAAKRWCHVTQLVLGISVCFFVVGAANNNAFIQLWVGEGMTWAPINSWLFALYCFMLMSTNAVFSMVGLNKCFGATRMAPYLDALIIAVNGVWMTRLWGISGMLLAACSSQIVGRLWLGLRHLASVTETSVPYLFRESMLRGVLILPFAAAVTWACSLLSPLLPGYAGLLLSATTGTALSGTIVLYLGVTPQVREELIQMLLKPLEKIRKLNKKAAQP